MEIKKENIELWEMVQATDTTYTKKVTFGRNFTAIDPHYQLLQATKLWGSFGKGWGVKNESFTNIKMGQKLIGDVQGDIYLCQYSATFFYPDGEFPINSAINISTVTSKGKWAVDEEYSKKVSTNALSKGLSKLGFSADVFLGAFDGNQYIGIDNIGVQGEATTEQLDTIKSLLEAEKNPERVAWIKKQLSTNLTEKTAKMVIDQIQGRK